MERIIPHPRHEAQQELLREYCRRAEQSVNGAGSHDEALRLADELCARFKTECDSSLVVTGTRLYLEHLIRARWKTEDGTGHHEDHQH